MRRAHGPANRARRSLKRRVLSASARPPPPRIPETTRDDTPRSAAVRQVRAFWLVPLFYELAIFANIKLLQTSSVETAIVFRTLVPLITWRRNGQRCQKGPVRLRD